MRLTEYEINSIKEIFDKIFKDSKLYLFGSRIDDSLRGGDIDLFIVPIKIMNTEQILDKKSKFRMALFDKIGEQKIDILISKDKNRSIEKEVLKTGVLL